jgi:hypothetical protein
MQPQQGHMEIDMMGMMGLQAVMTYDINKQFFFFFLIGNINKQIDNILKERAKPQWTNLPSLSFRFCEHQPVQTLLSLKFHTSQRSLQNCAAYTCRVVNQQTN